VEYIYHDANHLTSVTSILEPRAAENGPTPETQIVYWGPEDETPFGDGAWNGLVRSVTPPYDEERGSPVVTEYEYDAHGHLAYEQEGPPRGRTTPLPVENWITSDAAGQTTNCRNAAGCGDIVRDGNGNVLGITCCVMFAPPGGGQTSWLPFETCERPSVPPLYGEFEADPYTPNGEPTTLTNTIVDGSQYPTEVSVRQQLFSFDHLGRQTDRYSSTTEPGPSVPAMQRNFYYAENWTAGTADRWGPDGQHSYTQTDAAGRVTSFTRGAIEATQTYYDDDAVHTITYHNGTRTHYTYDDTGRPVIIRHETTQSDRLLELGYTWSADGLVDSIAELDDEDSPSKTIFTYDNRNRLTAEVRVGQHPYSLAYAYDLAGNRTAKVDVRNELQTEYVYDVSDPGQYGSQGNRLMASTLSGPGGVVEQRWYVYDLIGNVELVIRRITGDVDENENQWYRGTQLYYTKDGHLWMSRALRWQYDPECESENPPEGCEVVNCEYLAAMEYRYQGGRGRYMVRPRDPETMQLYPYTAADGQWFDYDGEGIYGDYSVSYDEQTQQWLATNTLAHEPGLAQYDHAWQALHHLHGNLIGTTERMTDGAGSIAHRAVYTAFGELIDESGAVGTRYGYAGAYGYQSASSQEPADPLAELGWLHVGERYYDPSAGRFVQRDPIGIRGGLNVYEYAKSGPVILVDPAGLTSSLYSPQGCAALIEAEIAVGGGNPVPVQFGTRMPVMVATTTIENATGELSLWPVGGGKAIIIAGDTTITAAQRAGGGVVIEGMTKPPTAGASSHHGWVVIVLGLLVAGPHLVRLAWFRRRLLRAYASSVAELLGGRGA
jgi:RHS repeat-associated protein